VNAAAGKRSCNRPGFFFPVALIFVYRFFYSRKIVGGHVGASLPQSRDRESVRSVLQRRIGVL